MLTENKMSTLEKIADQIRPCVKFALEKGARDRDHLKKMTFAIIYELNRLHVENPEIKMALLEWNDKNYRVLSAGDAQRQLCAYVDWFFKHECKLSCKALEDYCLLPDGGCLFKPASYNGEITLPFSLLEAISFLEKEYHPHGYLMGLLLRILFAIQKEKNAKNIIYVGLREIQARILSEYGHRLEPMQILRALNKLEEAGLIRITHGQPGTSGTRQANGYIFLPWTPPVKTGDDPQRIITHLCNTTETQLLCNTHAGDMKQLREQTGEETEKNLEGNGKCTDEIAEKLPSMHRGTEELLLNTPLNMPSMKGPP